MDDPLERFNEDYRYVRRELIRGQNPFVTTQSTKDWIKTRVDSVVAEILRQRQGRMQSSMKAHPDREVEWFGEDKRRRGEKEEDDE